jgi:hypothetical protein
MELTEIYKTLQQRKLVEDQYDFSTGWLGKSRSYYSVMISLQRKPSIEVLTTLLMRLKAKTQLLNEHGQFEVQSRAIQQTVAYLKLLTTEIICEIQQRCSVKVTAASKTAQSEYSTLKSVDNPTAMVI